MPFISRRIFVIYYVAIFYGESLEINSIAYLVKKSINLNSTALVLI